MENSVSKVKVEELDTNVLGTDAALEEANGGVESISTSIKVEEPVVDNKDESFENVGDLGVSPKLDGSINAAQGVGEESQVAFETPRATQTAMEKPHVDPVEDDISTKAIDGESTSDNVIIDLPVVMQNENNEIVDSDEIIAEAQLEPDPKATRRKGKGKAKRASRAKPNGRAKPIKWTVEEETTLCKAWKNITNDRCVSNNQTSEVSWSRIIEYFKKSFPDSTRTYDMLHSKWRDVRSKVGCFCEKYNSAYNNRKSGQSDVDIFRQAIMEFKVETSNDFTLVHCWEVLKDCEIFKSQPGPEACSTSSKRSRSTASTPTTNTPIARNFDLRYGFEDTFRSSLNPNRRQKTKRVESSSSAHCNSVDTNLLSTMTRHISTLVETMHTIILDIKDRQKQREEERKQKEQERARKEQERTRKEEERARKNMEKELEYYYFTETEGLSGKKLEFVIWKKAEIRMKYQLED